MAESNTPSGRFDLPAVGSDLKRRDAQNKLPGRIGTMQGWLIDQVKELRGLDFSEKKEPKKPEPAKPADPAKPKEEEKSEKKEAKKS